MKTKLLLLVFIYSLNGFSQVPITSYFGAINYNYADLTAVTLLDHTTSGANAIWNFNSLTASGSLSETNATPTATELSTFPTTTSVHIVTATDPIPSNLAKIYTKTTPSNSFSFTGFDANGIILNYVTNNATLGTFPVNFGFSNNDTTGGTFIYDTNTGTFTGTITANYDSYGTLNIGVTGFAPIVKNVFRLKVIQNINLSVGFPVGNVVQTTYTYYINEVGVIKPFFRDTKYVVNVPLLSIVNQTNSVVQVFSNALTLSASTFNADSNMISIYPNPSTNKLTINNKNNLSINSVLISDTNGRTIFESKNDLSTIDISDLSKGIYFLEIATDSGKVIKKFIKE